MTELSKQDEDMLRDAENAAFLRDLYHSHGWELYCKFAKNRLEAIMKHYLREDLTRDEIIECHLKLQAVSEFQSGMEELVRTAVDFVDPSRLYQMILSDRIPPDV